MKFIGQYIQQFIARFRSDVYLENLSNPGTDTDKFLVVDANNKVGFRTGAEVVSDGSFTDTNIANTNLTQDANRTVSGGGNSLTFSGQDEVTVNTIFNFKNTTAAPDIRINEASGSGTNYIKLTCGALASNTTLTLPNVTGTVAVTSDIPTNTNIANTDLTFTGSRTLNLNGDDLTLNSGANVEINAGDFVVNTSNNAQINSSTSSKPLFQLKNTTNDASGAILKFVKDKGAAGAANDVNGLIQFFGDDANQDQVMFSEVKSQVKVHTNGQEGGKFTVSVAEHDGTSTSGLVIEDGSQDGELDVTIASGAASLTTIAGDVKIQGDLVQFTQAGSFQDPAEDAFITWVEGGITGVLLATDLDFGTYDIRAKSFTSDVATGTAPFTVSSTTQVANLNAATAGSATTAAACTGNSATATTAQNSINVAISDDESTNEDHLVTFVGNSAVGSNGGLNTDGDLTYNPSTGKVTATGFIGALTGQADTAVALTTGSKDITGTLNVKSSAADGNPLLTFSQTTTRRAFIQLADNFPTGDTNHLRIASEYGPVSIAAASTSGSDTDTVYLKIDPEGVFTFGAADSDAVLTTDGSMTFRIDADNDETSQKFAFQNNASTEIANLDESGNLQIDGGLTTGSTSAINSSGVLQVAAQTNITSLGTLTALNVDDINLDLKRITIVGDTDDTFTITSGTHGETTIETVDTAGASANLNLVADGAMTATSTSFTSTTDAFNIISGTAGKPELSIINSNTDTKPPEIILQKTATGGASDGVGLILFIGDDDANNEHTYAGIQSQIVSAANNSEAGKMKLEVATSAGSGTGNKVGILISGSATANDVDVTIGAETTSTTTVTGNLVANRRRFSVTGNTDGSFDGDVVFIGGTTSMITGRIYHYNSSGNWELANPNAAATSDGLLGVALGAASDTNGVLLRGMVTLDHDPGAVGDVLFLNKDQVADTGGTDRYGAATATSPNGNGDIVRIIGYCLDASNGQVWFNPDNTFVEYSVGG